MPRRIGYSEKLGIDVCIEMSKGRTLDQICKEDKFPPQASVLAWRFSGNYPDFERRYDLARQIQAERFANELVDLADNAKDATPAQVQKVKLQVETRKWVIARILRKIYGDTKTLEVDVTEHAKLLLNFGGAQPPPDAIDVAGVEVLPKPPEVTANG